MASESVRSDLSTEPKVSEPATGMDSGMSSCASDVVHMFNAAFNVMEVFMDTHGVAAEIPDEPPKEFWKEIGCQPPNGAVEAAEAVEFVDEPMVDINGSLAPAWVARSVPRTPPSPGFDVMGEQSGVAHLRPCVTPPELLIVPTTPPELLAAGRPFPCDGGCRLRCVQWGFTIPGCNQIQVNQNQPYTPLCTPPRSPSHSPPPSPSTPPLPWGSLHMTPPPTDAQLSTPPRVVRRRNRVAVAAGEMPGNEQKRRRM